MAVYGAGAGYYFQRHHQANRSTVVMKHLHIIRYVVIHKFTGSQGEAVKQQMENNKNNKPEQKKNNSRRPRRAGTAKDRKK